MARRRMVTRTICGTVDFLSMPKAAQALYLALAVETDDDGIVDSRMIMKVGNFRKRDLDALISNEYVTLIVPEKGIVWLTGWQSFNTVKTGQGTPSVHREALLRAVPDMKNVVFEGKTKEKKRQDSAPEVESESVSEPDKKSSSSSLEASNDTTTTTDHSDDQLKGDFMFFSDYCKQQCYPLSAINPSILYDKLVRNDWKTSGGKPITDLQSYLAYCYDIACQKNPSIEEERQKLLKEREVKLEKERKRQKEAEKYQSQSLYLKTADDFINYIRNEKPFSHEEAVKKVAIGYVFTGDEELAELWNPQPVFVSESYGYENCQFIRYDPNNGIIGFDGYMYGKLDTPLIQKVKKDFWENGDPKRELYEFLSEMELFPEDDTEPEPFRPKNAFEELQ